MGDPFFCKYLCPQGVLEGALPLAADQRRDSRRARRSCLPGKQPLLLAVVVLTSVLLYRPFCKWLCPLGAFYALLNKRLTVSRCSVDTGKCVSCGACARACKMDVDITKIAQPYGVHPLRHVHEGLPDGRNPIYIWLW